MEPIMACLAGVVLGLHLNVLVMIPVTMLATGLAISYMILFGQSFLSFGYFLALIVVHQAGYFVGLTGRDLYASLRRRLLPSPTKHS